MNIYAYRDSNNQRFRIVQMKRKKKQKTGRISLAGTRKGSEGNSYDPELGVEKKGVLEGRSYDPEIPMIQQKKKEIFTNF